jgi:hypothetical protein
MFLYGILEWTRRQAADERADPGTSFMRYEIQLRPGDEDRQLVLYVYVLEAPCDANFLHHCQNI